MDLITDPQHTPSLHSPTKPPDGPTRNAGLAAHLTKPTRPLFVLDWIYAPTPHHFACSHLLSSRVQMPQILFSLEQPQFLVLAVICTTITIYLLTRRDKTRDLRLLLGAFSCWNLYFLFTVTRESVVYPATAWCPIVEFAVGLLGLTLLIGFAYNFLREPYPSESRVVMAVAGTAV